MALLHPAEGSGRQRADDDDAHPPLARTTQEIAEVLRRESRRHRDARARVRQVVAGLRGVGRAGVARLMQRRRRAERGHTTNPHRSLLDQLPDRGHDLAQHVLQADGAGAAGRLDVVVELEQIDALEPEATQARVERARDRARNVGEVAPVDAELRPDVHLRLQRLQHLAEVLLGLAVAVGRRGVEVVDAKLDRPRDRSLSLGRRAANDQPATLPHPKPSVDTVSPVLPRLRDSMVPPRSWFGRNYPLTPWACQATCSRAFGGWASGRVGADDRPTPGPREAI